MSKFFSRSEPGYAYKKRVVQKKVYQSSFFFIEPHGIKFVSLLYLFLKLFILDTLIVKTWCVAEMINRLWLPELKKDLMVGSINLE